MDAWSLALYFLESVVAFLKQLKERQYQVCDALRYLGRHADYTAISIKFLSRRVWEILIDGVLGIDHCN